MTPFFTESQDGNNMTKAYLDPTPEAATALFTSGIEGEVSMLNLLRFREIADYSEHPDLAPGEPISGREAYRKYMAHTLPFLEESGGKAEFLAEGGKYFIGPQDEQWDIVMIVQQRSLADFMAFATNEGYKAGLGHRTAALEDSRLLPMVKTNSP
jgi:uncharacterized protein (DUF1330 family)